MEIQDELDTETVPDFIWKEFFLDQAINDRGILIDKEFAEKAIILNADEKSKILSEMKALTGLGNPNSVAQMKEWLKQKSIIVPSLDKKSVENLMPTVPDDVKEALKLRQKLSKSSVKKYEAMIHAACADHRARGMFSFYGASRTGRFSGRLIQSQNLPQNHFNDLEASKRLIKAGAYDQLREAHEDVTDVLSQLIRTALIPPEGKKSATIYFFPSGGIDSYRINSPRRKKVYRNRMVGRRAMANRCFCKRRGYLLYFGISDIWRKSRKEW